MQRFLVPQGVSAESVLPMITHDLCQPITAIKGYSQLVVRQPDLSPRLSYLLSTLVVEVNHLAGLLEDLSLVSRLERGLLSAQLAPVNLSGLIRNTIEVAEEGMPIRDLDDLGASAVEANCDSALTQRALANVIRYSLKLRQRDRPMQIGPVGTGPNPAILISTGGPGGALPSSMYPEPEIGQPPGEPAECRPIQELSLFIATRLVELQGGQVWGEDRAREGAGFLVILPPLPASSAVESRPKGE